MPLSFYDPALYWHDKSPFEAATLRNIHQRSFCLFPIQFVNRSSVMPLFFHTNNWQLHPNIAGDLGMASVFRYGRWCWDRCGLRLLRGLGWPGRRWGRAWCRLRLLCGFRWPGRCWGRARCGLRLLRGLGSRISLRNTSGPWFHIRPCRCFLLCLRFIRWHGVCLWLIVRQSKLLAGPMAWLLCRLLFYRAFLLIHSFIRNHWQFV